MTPPPARRHLEDVARRLLGPLLGPGKLPGDFRLVGWDAEQGVCLTFERDGMYLLIEIERRSDDLACFSRTRRFNLCAGRPFDRHLELTAEDRRFLEHVVAVIRTREDDLEEFDRPTTGRRRAVREILVERMLVPEGKNHYYLNPYAGCMIGCPYCYVRDRADFSRSLEGLPAVEWGRYADVKINGPEILRQEVRDHPPGIVRMSPILTDPYQPLERHHRITRTCLDILFAHGFRPVVLTRAARILDDLGLFADNPRSLVGFSIPSDQDKFRRIFEPGADPVEERLEALEAFKRAGVPTLAVIQPVLPMDADRLVELVAPRVGAVRIDRMYFLQHVRHLYREHGLDEFMTDAYFDRTVRQLEQGFRARGIRIEELDDLSSLVPG